MTTDGEMGNLQYAIMALRERVNTLEAQVRSLQTAAPLGIEAAPNPAAKGPDVACARCEPMRLALRNLVVSADAKIAALEAYVRFLEAERK